MPPELKYPEKQGMARIDQLDYHDYPRKVE